MILGIHSAGHDTGVAIVAPDGVLCAVESERITRRKHESEVAACLNYVAKNFPEAFEQVHTVAFSTPLRRKSFLISDKDAEGKVGWDQFSLHTECMLLGRHLPAVVVQHEICHAACTLAASGWKKNTLVVVNEGRGLRSRNCTYFFDGDKLIFLEADALPWFASGFGWTAIAYLCGYTPTPSIAGTIMAMSAYGQFSDLVADSLLRIPATIAEQPRAVQEKAALWLSKQVFAARTFEEQANVAATLQELFCTYVEALIRKWKRSLQIEKVALGGGCALNIVANTRLRSEFGNLGIWPACNDAGQAVGAAFWVSHEFSNRVDASLASVRVNGHASDLALDQVAWQNAGWVLEAYDADKIVRLLGEGNIVAWAEGVSAVGPRSLGERSYLASPSNIGSRRTVSEEVKGREWFRPLSPILRRERLSKLMPDAQSSPHMLYAYPSMKNWPEATHRDGSARLQTLVASELPRLHHLLSCWEKNGACDALINTSLNRKGEPICHTADDVRRALSHVPQVRAAVINDVLLTRG